MKRLTRAKFDVCKDCENLNCLYIEYNRNPAFECLYKIVFDRLAIIEDVLGDEYELDRLRELVEADRVGHCVVFDPHYPVVSEYYKDEDGRFIRETSGVISEAEYEAALKAREQE